MVGNISRSLEEVVFGQLPSIHPDIQNSFPKIMNLRDYCILPDPSNRMTMKQLLNQL